MQRPGLYSCTALLPSIIMIVVLYNGDDTGNIDMYKNHNNHYCILNLEPGSFAAATFSFSSASTGSPTIAVL